MVPKEFDIAGKSIIVTGAARGIGRGIVRVLAEAGANVMVTALTDKYLRPLGEELTSSGHSVITLAADATTSQGWDRALDLALERWGGIDVLINNLGDAIGQHIVPLPDSGSGAPISDEEWRRVLDINLTEAFLGCRTIGPHMLERRQGKVINVSGIAAKKGRPGNLTYSVAKTGLIRLTQTLALEWAPYGVTVNCIAPGSFPDLELAAETGASVERKNEDIPLGRVGDPREVGLLALYLASGASDYLTGETIYIDGGFSHV